MQRARVSSGGQTKKKAGRKLAETVYADYSCSGESYHDFQSCMARQKFVDHAGLTCVVVIANWLRFQWQLVGLIANEDSRA